MTAGEKARREEERQRQVARRNAAARDRFQQHLNGALTQGSGAVPPPIGDVGGPSGAHDDSDTRAMSSGDGEPQP